MMAVLLLQAVVVVRIIGVVEVVVQVLLVAVL